MNEASKQAQSDPGAGSAQESEPGDSTRAHETWLDRLRTAVGLRGAGTLRQDIAAALAAPEGDAVDFTPEERAMLANILRLRDVRVDDVMVPRADIEAVEIDATLGELLVAFLKSGHSRMPVFRETLDDPVGLVHIKDLMAQIAEAAGRRPPAHGDGKPADGASPPGDNEDEAVKLDLACVDLGMTLAKAGLVRNILFVPPSMPVATLLANMQAARMQMALVIDEYGGTDGLVSLEDALEMVVGEIEDEHDDDVGPMIVPDKDGGFLADARADLDEVAEVVGTDFDAGEHGEDVDTIGGLVYALVGRIPVRGELVSAPGGYEFEILDADPRRIKRLRISKRPAGTREARRRRPPPAESGAPAAE
jgi:CBS domain containing-hemolysin-like protein